MPSPYDNLIPGDDKSTELIETQPQENNMNSKPLVKSKTFWVNLATAVAGVLVTLGGSDLVQDNPQLAGVFATVIGVANVLLRLVTKEPVSVTGK